ncbi:MAG: universal stress protein [Propionibacteriaceae bacterium]|jgi:nucleotide-binding universal stress UspA family protein|nr:universal stress protein [Propionibacteriaceae bacterium]
MEQSLPITIGFDGSPFAFAAVRKGLWLAGKLGAPVRIVRAWTISNAPRPATWQPGYVPPVEDFGAAVEEQTRRELAGVLAEFPDADVSIEVPHGAAGRELIAASAQSSLIVVGTRGLGGFAGLLLGSVSDQVVEHAQCDVLVARLVDADPAPERALKLDQAIG